jgi:hypothetical protein
MRIDKHHFLDALAKAAYIVSVEKLLLTGNYDAPIYPESLVQVVVAKQLHETLYFSRVELEYPAATLESELFGGPRPLSVMGLGRLDLICWDVDGRVYAVEVKDELTGTNDGLVKDAGRSRGSRN